MVTPWPLAGLVFLAALLQSAPASPAPPPTVLVLPLDAGGGLSDLGYGLGLRILEVLRSTGGANLVHPKMLARVEARYEDRLLGLDPAERRARLGRVLGADRILHGRIDPRRNRLRLQLQTTSGGAAVEESLAEARFETLVARLPRAVVGLARRGEMLPEAVAPDGAGSVYASRDRQAILDHAACHRALMRQPMGIGRPIVVDEAAIRIAMDACLVALERDDLFASARADLALAHAFLGERKEAERLLIELKDTPGFHPTYWLARFWILSRYYDADLALESMETAIAAHPGFMLGRGYLGEALLALGRPEAARPVFEAYLARCPDQSYVMGRLAIARERSGDVYAAIEWVERALELNPEDPELLFQKGERLLGAGIPLAAIPLFESVVRSGGARAEVHAELGRARLAAGDREGAERALRRAIEKATGPSGWRTRNRARYDLARLWAGAGAPENAIRPIRRALLEGFVDRPALAEPPLVGLQKHPEFKKLRQVRARPGVKPRLVSPLGRVTASGSLEPRNRFERRSDRKVLERL